MRGLIFTPCPLLDCYESGHHSHVRFAATSCDGDHGPSALGTRCYSPRVIDPDAELIVLISDALANECGSTTHGDTDECGFDHDKYAAVLLRELREVADVTPKAVMGDE